MADIRFDSKRNLLALLLAVFAFSLLTISVFASQDKMLRQEISFISNGNLLKGVLVTPAGNTAAPCLVFVHGSGATPRDNYGYYKPYWQRFAQKGWCSLSWDKPGVGASEGDWQLQSMDDRAMEVSAAMDFLRSRPGMKNTPIGLIGISQAGWVMPKLSAMRNDLAFIISISGAIDWMEQSRYSGDIRLKSEGYSPQEIQRIKLFEYRMDLSLRDGDSYQSYLALMEIAPKGEDRPMSEKFWNFVQLNWRSNVRDDLRNINVPVLALFGANDAYVDAVKSAQVYRQELEISSAPFFEIVTFEGADHALMQSDKIQPSNEGLGALLVLFKIWFGNEKIFPDGYMTTLENWLDRFN